MGERITFDRSATNIVSVCTCGWRDLNAVLSLAINRAHDHQLRTHQADARLNDTIRTRRRRQDDQR